MIICKTIKNRKMLEVKPQGRVSRRRRSLRLAIGANKKIMAYSVESGVTVGVMRIDYVKVIPVPTEKANKGVEKSCRVRRRKRGLRKGKRRSRVGKTRRSVPSRPSNPKPPGSPSAHYTRLYVWVLRKANDLFRKGCEPRLADFDRIWFPPRGRPLDLSRIDAYRKCRARYRAIQSTAKRGHLEKNPELMLGRNLWEFCEKRRPQDLGGLLGAIGVRPSQSKAATGFGRDPDGSFVFGRSKPADLPRHPTGIRAPDTSVVRKRIERKRDVEINQRRSDGRRRTAGANNPCCQLAGRADCHTRDCPVGKSLVIGLSRRTRQ